jgi:hypothetical protein
MMDCISFVRSVWVFRFPEHAGSSSVTNAARYQLGEGVSK